MSLETRIVAWPPFAASIRAQLRAVEVGDHPGRDRQRDRDRVRLAEAVVDEDDARSRRRAPRAPPSRRTCRLPRETSAILPVSESLGSVPRLVFGSVAGPAEMRLDGLAVGADDASRRRRSSGRASTTPPGSFAPPAPWIGIAPSDGGPPTTESAGAKTCEFDVAATEIASGAVPGEPAVPRPKSSRSLPGGDHRDDAGERGVVDRLVHRVVRRIGLRAAAREVDHVHAVGDRRLECVARSPACSPRGRAASGR